MEDQPQETAWARRKRKEQGTHPEPEDMNEANFCVYCGTHEDGKFETIDSRSRCAPNQCRFPAIEHSKGQGEGKGKGTGKNKGNAKGKEKGTGKNKGNAKGKDEPDSASAATWIRFEGDGQG